MNEAIRHMEAAWRLMPTPGEAGNLIYFHSGAGRPDRGLELYEKNREHLQQPRVHAAAGMGYLLAGKPEEAEAAFHQALEGVSDGNFAAEVHLHLARLAHEADRPRQVDRHLRRGLSLDLGSRGQLAGPPGSPFRRWWTGGWAESLQAVGGKRIGVKGMLTAVRRELEYREHLHQPRVHAAAGMGYLLAGRTGEAEAAFHQALEGVSDDGLAAEVHLHLARLAHEADRPSALKGPISSFFLGGPSPATWSLR